MLGLSWNHQKCEWKQKYLKPKNKIKYLCKNLVQLLETPFRHDSFTRLLRYEIKGNLWLLAFHRFKISDQKKLVSPFLLATSIVCICYLICVKTMEHMLSPGGKEEPGRATAHSFIHAHALLLLLSFFFRQNNAGNFLNRNLSFWCNDTLL